MVTPELLNFIRQSLATGSSTDTIKQTLLSQGGWDIQDIEKGISMVASVAPAQSAPPATNVLIGSQNSTQPAPASTMGQQNSAQSSVAIDNESSSGQSHKSLIITVIIILAIIAGYFVFAEMAGISPIFKNEESTRTSLADNSLNTQLENIANTTTPKQTLINSSDCGVSSLEILTSLLLGDGAYITDPVISCLSQRLVSCSAAKGRFVTDSAETTFEFSGGDNCEFTLQFMDEPINDDLSGKSITCPMSIMKSPLFAETQKNPTNSNSLTVAQLYEFGYWGGKLREDVSLQSVSGLGCTGTLPVYYEELFSSQDDLPG